MTGKAAGICSLEGRKALTTGISLPVDGGFLSSTFTPP